MVSKTPSRPVNSPSPAMIPDTGTGPGSNGTRVATEPDIAVDQAPAETANGRETRAERFRRKANRGWLHGSAIATVALVAYLIALAASNTAAVKVDWVFGSSRVSLVWLVLFAAILGWLLGLLASAKFHWSTRAPRDGRGARS